MTDCEYPSSNHSGIRVEVYYGEVKPMILCGFHASTIGPATFEMVRLAREQGKTPDELT